MTGPEKIVKKAKCSLFARFKMANLRSRGTTGTAFAAFALGVTFLSVSGFKWESFLPRVSGRANARNTVSNISRTNVMRAGVAYMLSSHPGLKYDWISNLFTEKYAPVVL